MTKLYLRIKFYILEDRFEVESNIKPGGIKSIVENVIRAQIGDGEDGNKAKEHDAYTIDIDYSMNDTFVIKTDTGNEGLTVGILMKFLAEGC